jgi:hypothetical protein
MKLTLLVKSDVGEYRLNVRTILIQAYFASRVYPKWGERKGDGKQQECIWKEMQGNGKELSEHHKIKTI